MASDPSRLHPAWALAIHELRTPLAIASGYLRMLREQAGALTDMQRKMLDETGKACGCMGAIIAEMSELERLEAGEVSVPSTPFDLAALVVELGGRLIEGQDRGVHLEVRATRPVMVAGDRTRLAATLSALMHATLQERSEPGVIVVECSTLPGTSQTWAIVTIADEVTTRSLVDVASEPPPQFDEWRGGLGLALPLGRRVIEAHGGALWSAPGGAPRAGSALRLPVAT